MEAFFNESLFEKDCLLLPIYRGILPEYKLEAHTLQFAKHFFGFMKQNSLQN
jgi:hypothetical protein